MPAGDRRAHRPMRPRRRAAKGRAGARPEAPHPPRRTPGRLLGNALPLLAALLLLPLALPARAAAPSPAALQAATSADESLRFQSLVTALSTAPDNPADLALAFADGGAAVVRNGRVALRLPAAPAPVTAIRWMVGSPLDYLLYGRTARGVTRYTVAPIQGRAPPQRLNRCHGAHGILVTPSGEIAWRCGSSLTVATPSTEEWGPTGVDAFAVRTVAHLTLATPPAAGEVGAAPWSAGAVAVDGADGVIRVQIQGVLPEILPGRTLDVGPGPARMAWSRSGALAVASPRGLFLWSRSLGLRRFPGVQGVRQMLWTADGLHVEVLRRLNPGATPPDYAVQQLGLDGSTRTLLAGRLGFVLGLSADGSLLWREEGVAAGVYAQGPAGAGTGPFRLQAVPLPAPPPAAQAPLSLSGPVASAGGGLAWMLQGGGLLRTTDGGATWTDAAPSGYVLAPDASRATTAPQPSPPISVGGPASLTLMRTAACSTPGCYDAWSVATGPGGAPTVLFTPNGGTSWLDLHPSGLPAVAGTRPPVLQFASPEDGWLAAFPCCQGRTETQEVALWRTADGGRAWTAAGSVWTHNAGHTPPQGSPAPQGIPVSFGARGGRTAWVTGVAARQPWLYETTDGGASWRNVRLPAPAGLGHAFTLSEPPHFFTARDGVLPVLFGVKLRAGDYGWQWVAFPEFAAAGGPALVLYQTRDGGRTWTATAPLHVNETMRTSTPSGVSVQWLSPQTAVVSDGLRLSLTTDGGANWHPMAPFPSWETFSNGTPLFSSARDATAWLGGGLMPAERMVTLDGGRRWQEEPSAVLASVPPPLGAYTPPRAVAAVALPGPWTAGAPQAGWRGRPVAAGMGPPVRESVGEPVPLEVDVQSAVPLTLARPLRLQVRIVMAEAGVGPGGAPAWLDGGGPVVWRGTLPALPRLAGRMRLRFTWDGRDAAAQPVPPGVYDAQLVTPLPVATYRSGGRARAERLPGTPALTGSQTYAEAITLSAAPGAGGAA